METKRILLNRIQCNECKDIITSYHTHDFNWCKCGKTAVDGGTDYLKRVGEHNTITELSIYDDGKHSTRRKALYWGQMFDKQMKRLPKTVWRPIKDLNIGHIKAIIKIFNADSKSTSLEPIYQETFIKELKYRYKAKTKGK